MATPPSIPAGARSKVAQALLKAGLVHQVQRGNEDGPDFWTIGGGKMLLGLTAAGRAAVAGKDAPQAAQGVPQAAQEPEPRHEAKPAPDAAQGPPQAAAEPKPRQEGQDAPEAAQARRQAPRANLRDAAAAVLAAWDDEANREADIIGALEQPMAALRVILAGKPARAPREPGALRKPREGTKQEQVLAMLRRPEGATVAQIAETTGWAQHTVRGFFAGLKKKGHTVEVLERVKQVGPNKQGAKGSYSVYSVASPVGAG